MDGFKTYLNLTELIKCYLQHLVALTSKITLYSFHPNLLHPNNLIEKWMKLSAAEKNR